MAPSKHHNELLKYLTEKRGYPAELAKHMATHGFRLLTEGVQVRHVLVETFGLRKLKELPDQALVIPHHLPDGEPMIDPKTGGEFQRVRCDPPAKGPDGDERKYLAPQGSINHLSIPPEAIARALETKLLIITEGELKAWTATWYGFPTIGMSGVWNWLSSPGGKKRISKSDGSHEWEKPKGIPIPDLDLIPWDELRQAGVRVFVIFDSDAAIKIEKGGVSHARAAAAKHVREDRGMDVWIADLPDEPGGEKNGLDDYLLRHGPEALRSVLEDARPSSRQQKQRIDAEVAMAAEMGLISIADMTDEQIEDRIRTLRERKRTADEKEMRGLERDIQDAKDELSYREAEARFGLNLRGTPYLINEGGVQRKVRGKGTGDPLISTRPIWPATVGRDLATGDTYVELAWIDAHGKEIRAWVPHRALSDPRDLCALDGANVTRGRVNKVSDFVGDATGYLTDDRKSAKVASRMGWVGTGDARQFILPGAAGVTFIGQGWEVAGTPDAWAEGLRMLAELGPEGFVGLSVVGLCAGAPLVRFLGYHRNPTLGLVGTSGRGKNTLIEYGLSVWGQPSALTVSIGSTQKGIQDATIYRAGDMPFFVDELQRLYNQDHDGPKETANLLYFLGNGQRRTTSSRSQQAVGGERRWGANLYASETPIAESMPTGAGNRVIELEAPIKVGNDLRFVPDKAFSDKLKSLTGANQGAIAAQLADIVTRDQTRMAAEVAAIAEHIGNQHPGLQGDDHIAIAIVVVGLVLVSEVTGVELPALDVGQALAEYTTRERSERKDLVRQAFESVCGLALGADFREYMPQDFGPPARVSVDHAIVNGEYIAWRSGPSFEWLDINPHHPLVETRLRRFGDGKALAKAWTQRGWLLRQEEGRVGWKRGGVGRVWRISGQVLDGVTSLPDEEDEGKTGNFPSLHGPTGKTERLMDEAS